MNAYGRGSDNVDKDFSYFQDLFKDTFDHGWDWAPNFGDSSEFGLNGENTPKMFRFFGLWSMITTMSANKGD